MSRQSSPSTHPGFSGDSLSKAWVLGSNGTLWYELGPGEMSPLRVSRLAPAACWHFPRSAKPVRR